MKLSIPILMLVLIISLQPIAFPQTVLQGGDNINNAFPISYIPFSDNGTTLGYIDDYTGSCGPALGAPDVVYSFAPATDMVIMASLCQGSDFDTRLYVFEDNPNNIVACNDDYCSNQFSDYISAIPCLELYGGHNYYFVIDGYGSARGNYTFTLTLPTPGVAITGVVTESGDGPLGGVNIRVLSDGTQVWQDTTSALGIYNVIYLAPGTYTVEASKTGYLTQISEPVYISTCQNAHVDFVLERIPPPPPIGIIEGVVTESDGATPIDSAIVVAVPQPDQGGFITTDTTNEQGYFRLPDMQTVLYDVTASRAGFISQTQYNIMVYSDQSTWLNFALQDSIILCPYMAGDVNGSGHFNGIDVTYLVAFFKGGMPPTLDCHPYCPNQPDPFYAAADMNGDCRVNGLDVIFAILVFKGWVPHPRYCPDCPPE